jgi:hypothetical protein
MTAVVFSQGYMRGCELQVPAPQIHLGSLGLRGSACAILRGLDVGHSSKASVKAKLTTLVRRP